MWRFLNNIPRAFRQYIHNPRPSVGIYNNVEEDANDQGSAEAEKVVCPFTGRTKSQKGEEKCIGRKYLNFARCGEKAEEGCESGTGSGSGPKKDRKWWQSCQNDFWSLLHSSNRMLEVLTLGTAMVWGTDTDRQRRKLRLLYRVLWAVPGADSQTRLGIKEQLTSDQPPVVDSTLVTPATPSLHLAIKDAAGAAHDAAVNESVTETLDSALEEFQAMCTEYTCRNESLLGLQAAQKGDMGVAVQHLKAACMLGNTSACFNIGLCYETGSGVTQDLDKAKFYYSQAANAGHSLALYNLGLLYLADQPNKETDDSNKASGLQLLENAAKAGLPEAQTYLGIHHIEENQDPDTAVPYFRAAANQNDSEAQYFLAICYEQGWGVEKNECRAAQLYSLSASAGHEAALYNLAVFNETGLGGLPEDIVAATDLYTKAAQLGNEQAKQRLKELEAQKSALKAKEHAFHSMYQLYHSGEVSRPQPSRPLSPSASSPTLTHDWNRDLSFYIGNLCLDVVGDKKNTKSSEVETFDSLFDPGGDTGKSRSATFSVGEVDEITNEKSMFDDVISQEMKGYPSFLHRSNTSPNLTPVACT